MQKILINAQNVNTGGGLVLLLDLLDGLSELENTSLVFYDERCDLEKFYQCKNITLVKTGSGFISRIAKEYQIKKISSNYSLALNVTNLPFFFRLACPAALFLQNRFFVSDYIYKPFSYKFYIKSFLLRCTFSLFQKNSSIFIVQTQSMKMALEKRIKNSNKIMVRPFGRIPRFSNNQASLSPDLMPTFIYPASAEPHKNHKNLFQAFRELESSGIKCRLMVTLEPKDFDRFCLKMGLQKLVKNAYIVNLGKLPHQKLIEFYKSSTALIFPSHAESFGLPLYEARLLNIPIIAAELDYVRDIAVPSETFDPNSYISIYRALKRFLGVPENMQCILPPQEFIESLKNDLY